MPKVVETLGDGRKFRDREFGQRRLERAEALAFELSQHLRVAHVGERRIDRDEIRGFGRGFGYYGFPHYYGFAHRGFYRPYHWGFYDPFWGSPFDYPEVYSYTVYNSFVDMKIARTGTNESVFEGRADANTRTDDLTRLVPNLVAAMFTNFPGRSGERVRVNVPLDSRRS